MPGLTRTHTLTHLHTHTHTYTHTHLHTHIMVCGFTRLYIMYSDVHCFDSSVLSFFSSSHMHPRWQLLRRIGRFVALMASVQTWKTKDPFAYLHMKEDQ